jgi:outer membrane protein OmpA-like peptidoglycan-associated protein
MRSFYPFRLLGPALLVLLAGASYGLAADNQPLNEQVASLMSEAEQLRAPEFSPSNYSKAVSARSEGALGKARKYARRAILISQKVSLEYRDMLEARDRMQLTQAINYRADLVRRAEKHFKDVINAIENGQDQKARRGARIALQELYAASVVAAREQIIRPLSKSIAASRKVSARKYAPGALDSALDAQRRAEKIIREDPGAMVKARNIARKGEEQARRAARIGALGTLLRRNPSELEGWLAAEDGRMMAIARALGIQLPSEQEPEEQLAAIENAILDIRQAHAAQMRDAEQQITELSGKLAKYEGELAVMQDLQRQYQAELSGMQELQQKYEGELSDMEELRHKLQLRREAEAKIKRIASLFDPEKTEILLTPDADVILRMKGMNFRSGSAVIPPQSYELLDQVVQAIAIFPDRPVRIEGHTDYIGTSDYNLNLSERRAESVREYITSVVEDHAPEITAVGYGEDRPVANNETAEARKKNRRIDIVLLVPGK